MTQDEILAMAKKAGLTSVDKKSQYLRDCLERFAKLVAAKEREACAQVCDDIDLECESEDVLATWCAESIRARGQE